MDLLEEVELSPNTFRLVFGRALSIAMSLLLALKILAGANQKGRWELSLFLAVVADNDNCASAGPNPVMSFREKDRGEGVC